MATIEKTSPTNWRITKMYKGTRYRLNVDRKPSKTEAERMIWSLIEKKPEKKTNKTFEDAAEEYIKSKSSVLSPSTVRVYNIFKKQVPLSLRRRLISAISNQDIQISINEYSATHKAKSTHNMYVFIVAVLHLYLPDVKFHVSLPQIDKPEFYVPEDEDVKRILDYVKDTDYEIPLWLAIYGLRRSEICALQKSDLDENNIITVNKAKVKNDKKQWVIKVTKTTDSTRRVPLSDYVAKLIRALPDGEIYKKDPCMLTRHLHKIQSNLGIPLFSLHKLRHYFAATAREVMGDAYVEKLGGWKPGSRMMKKVYDYTKEKQEKEAQDALIGRMGKLIG